MFAKHALSLLTRLAWPVARLVARRGYFSSRRAANVEPARIAIVACHWIGDTFWATQVVGPLRQRFPEAHLAVITKPACVDLWHGLVDGHDVLPAPEVISDRRRERVNWRAIGRLAASLRAREFDLVIDLTGTRYSAWFTFMLRPRASIGFGGDELGWLYSTRIDAERPGRHLSERPMEVLRKAIGNGPIRARSSSQLAMGNSPPLRPPAPTCTATEARKEFGLGPGPLYALAPGAGWAAKRWPEEKFIAAGQLLAGHGQVAVVGSEAEAELCRRVASGIGGAVAVAGGRLGHVIALLADARGVLTNDSGLAHLAASLGRPTAVVFTRATDPALCRPLGPAVAVFNTEDAVKKVVEHLPKR